MNPLPSHSELATLSIACSWSVATLGDRYLCEFRMISAALTWDNVDLRKRIAYVVAADHYREVRAEDPRRPPLDRLHGEPEVDDVAVLDDVVLALEPQLPRLAALGRRAGGDLARERHRGRRLGHVQHDEEGAEREEREPGEQRPLLGGEAEGAERRARLERRRQALEQRPLALVALLLLEPLEARLDDGQIGEHQLGREAPPVRGRGRLRARHRGGA